MLYTNIMYDADIENPAEKNPSLLVLLYYCIKYGYCILGYDRINCYFTTVLLYEICILYTVYRTMTGSIGIVFNMYTVCRAMTGSIAPTR